MLAVILLNAILGILVSVLALLVGKIMCKKMTPSGAWAKVKALVAEKMDWRIICARTHAIFFSVFILLPAIFEGLWHSIALCLVVILLYFMPLITCAYVDANLKKEQATMDSVAIRKLGVLYLVQTVGLAFFVVGLGWLNGEGISYQVIPGVLSFMAVPTVVFFWLLNDIGGKLKRVFKKLKEKLSVKQVVPQPSGA